MFFARSTAADNFRTLCAGRTDDRRRQQQQQCREHATTSWLQCYTTCCIAHSCFYRTLGSVIEDRAGTYDFCYTTINTTTTTGAVCSGLLCVKSETGTTVVLFCCCGVMLLYSAAAAAKQQCHCNSTYPANVVAVCLC